MPKRTKFGELYLFSASDGNFWNARIRLQPTDGGNLNYWTNYQSVNLYGHKEPRFVNKVLDVTRKCTAEIVNAAPTTT